MPVQYISGINADKQNLRRSSHLGSDLTSSYTILAAAETFDPQACFVYVNGAMLKEGTTGNGGDYVLSGVSTVTFNVALATTDVIEVISYNFTNSILPETMIETDHVITSANAAYHSTAITGASYAYATDTLTKSGHSLVVGDVINVTTSPTSNSLAVGRYRVKTVTSSSAVVLTTVNDVALTFSADSASANINYSKVFSLKCNNLTLQSKVLVYFNGMLVVENTDFYRDEQAVTFDSTVNLLENAVIAVRHFGSFVFPSSSEIQRSGIVIANDSHEILLTSADLTGNTTAVFNLLVSVRHATATEDAYRTAHILCRAEKNVAADCYLHRAYDAGNISDEIEVKDAGNYSAYSSITDGKVGVGITADSNYWYVYLSNRANYSIVAGFKAQAITN